MFFNLQFGKTSWFMWSIYNVNIFRVGFSVIQCHSVCAFAKQKVTCHRQNGVCEHLQRWKVHSIPTFYLKPLRYNKYKHQDFSK